MFFQVEGLDIVRFESALWSLVLSELRNWLVYGVAADRLKIKQKKVNLEQE